MKYRLGLDLGTNSLGWAILNIDKPDSISLVDMGVRVFPDGREPAGEGRIGDPKAVARRQARQARRQRDRRKRRQIRMLNLLIRQGYLPASQTERAEWLRRKPLDSDVPYIPARHLAHQVQTKISQILGQPIDAAESTQERLDPANPYWLRTKALDQKLEPFELGRVMMHIALRRGFKSNRKIDISLASDSETLKELKGNLAKIQNLEQVLRESGARTIGEYQWKRYLEGESVRFRPQGVELYPSRQMYYAEFQRIRTSQERHHPDFLWDRAEAIIFYQRPLKKQPRGRCTFYPEEERGYSALPSVQRFRIWQDIHNLAITNMRGESITLSNDEKTRLFQELDTSTKVTFPAIRRLLGIREALSFNLEDAKRDHLKGNVTAVLLRDEDAFGPHWDEFAPEVQDDIVLHLIDEENEETLGEFLRTHSLQEKQAHSVMGLQFPPGVGAVCVRFARECTAIMQSEFLPYFEATKKLGFDHSPYGEIPIGKSLPYYGQVLSSSTMGQDPTAPESEQEKHYGKVNNPTVHVALNQLRKVVNCLLERFGNPEEIVVELGRELKLSSKRAEEILREQAKNAKQNRTIDETLKELGIIAPSRDDRIKYRLWEELGTDTLGRACVYCGKTISATDLFNGSVEVEHILPRSRTLLDNVGNLTVSHKTCNNIKGNRTPYEAFSGNPSGFSYEEIQRRVQRIYRGDWKKRQKFSAQAMDEIGEVSDFLQRQITDNAYIARSAKRYLEAVCPPNKIWVTNGRLTYEARRAWGIDALLTQKSAIARGALKNRLGACRAEGAADALTERPSSRLLRPVDLVGRHRASSLPEMLVDRSLRAHFGHLQAVLRLQSRLMLYARQAKSHSIRTLAMPRSRNCRSPIALFMIPNTGSTLAARLP